MEPSVIKPKHYRGRHRRPAWALFTRRPRPTLAVRLDGRALYYTAGCAAVRP